MTKENSKKLYDFYLESGNIKAATNMLNKYPDFATKKKVVVEEVVEEKEKIKKK